MVKAPKLSPKAEDALDLDDALVVKGPADDLAGADGFAVGEAEIQEMSESEEARSLADVRLEEALETYRRRGASMVAAELDDAAAAERAVRLTAEALENGSSQGLLALAEKHLNERLRVERAAEFVDDIDDAPEIGGKDEPENR